MDKPENPPAFPTATHHDMAVVQEGMTLRDWYAGQALAQVTRDVFAEAAMAKKPPSELPAIIAAASYQIADALLAARGEA